MCMMTVSRAIWLAKDASQGDFFSKVKGENELRLSELDDKDGYQINGGSSPFFIQEEEK